MLRYIADGHLAQSSAINENHLEYFRFVGRIIGKAIFDQRILEAHFSRCASPFSRWRLARS